MTDDHAPCPFCASTSLLIQPGSSYGWKRVVCRGCGASGPEQRTEELAFVGWDARIEPST